MALAQNEVAAFLQMLRSMKVEQFELEGAFKVSFFSEEHEEPDETKDAVGFMADQNVEVYEDEDA